MSEEMTAHFEVFSQARKALKSLQDELRAQVCPNLTQEILRPIMEQFNAALELDLLEAGVTSFDADRCAFEVCSVYGTRVLIWGERRIPMGRYNGLVMNARKACSLVMM